MLAFLVARKVHATADEIYNAVNGSNPRLSRATVYNTLHALLEKGLVRAVSSEGSTSRYDARLHRHHHFVCKECGRIKDLEWFDLPAPLLATAMAAGEVQDIDVMFRGICAGCKS